MSDEYALGMFDELSERLDGVLGRFRGRGLLTESMIDEGLREIRRALLEADVNFQLAKDFLERVRAQATGEQVLKSVKPGEQVVKIVHDELVTLLGHDREGLEIAAVPRRGPATLSLAGAPVAAGWDDALAAAMTRAGVAVHEEAVLGDLLAAAASIA